MGGQSQGSEVRPKVQAQENGMKLIVSRACHSKRIAADLPKENMADEWKYVLATFPVAATPLGSELDGIAHVRHSCRITLLIILINFHEIAAC
jgi:hypothetical protein